MRKTEDMVKAIRTTGNLISALHENAEQFRGGIMFEGEAGEFAVLAAEVSHRAAEKLHHCVQGLGTASVPAGLYDARSLMRSLAAISEHHETLGLNTEEYGTTAVELTWQACEKLVAAAGELQDEEREAA